MKCTKCDTESEILINTYFDNKMDCLCADCFIALTPKLNDVSRIDKEIEKANEIIKQLEDILKNCEEADLSKFDDTLAAVAFTPSKSITMAKHIIADLQKQKEELLNSMSEKEVLTHKLKVAIQDKDYEFAISIKDELNK